MRHFVRKIALLSTLAAAVSSCGKGHGGGGGGGSSSSKVELAFVQAAHHAQVPARLMMAIGYLESRLAAERASANYIALDNAVDPVARGTIMTQTAFGIPMQELGLDEAREDSQLLDVQIQAYAAWLASKLADAHLTADPRTPEELFYWIDRLANLHRTGVTQRRNLQVIFARELIDLLNRGFIWQDPQNGERLELTPQNPPISIESFPPNGQTWMALTEYDATLRATATYIPLATVPSGEFVNNPRRIEVIHCPLSLSSCLELQSQGAKSDVHLSAHYVIPPERDIFSKVLQVADHGDALILTDSRGQSYPVVDAIVVMLVGNSGRLVKGARQPADPTWFRDGQLRSLGRLVNDLCTYLAQKTPELVQREACMATSGDQGVQFRHQGASEEYRWGDIADFDASIFDAYLTSPDGLGTEMAFELIQGKREFSRGQSLPLTLMFNSSVKTVELERLSRCRDGNVVWEPQETRQVRGENRALFQKILFDSGPNRNGDQYFRARAYGDDGKLLGWSIDRLIIRDFEEEPSFASEKHCKR